MRILFIVKKRAIYNSTGYSEFFQSGLYNSAKFICDKLKQLSHETHLVDVVDNNCIDREIALFKPNVCVIEGLWVVPSKFEILHKLHPSVKFIVRVHSRLPFLAVEGQAIEWIKDYNNYDVYVAPNTQDTALALSSINAGAICLSNYYPLPNKEVKLRKVDLSKDVINIGCFGAVRPMKNQLTQAFAVIKYADYSNKRLNFHINSARIESGGDPCIKNIRALFKNSKHNLVPHDWLPHHAFLNLVDEMDMNLCVSCSESFCIVAADSIRMGVPVITSEYVDWKDTLFCPNTNEVDSIFNAMLSANSWGEKFVRCILGIKTPWKRLEKHNKCALKEWEETLEYINNG